MDLGDAGRGKRADLRRPEPNTCGDDHRALADIAATGADVRLGPRRLGDPYRAVLLDRLLHGDDRVRALGHRAARRDRGSGADWELEGGRPARGDAERDRQRRRRLRRTDGEAVHRRARKWRKVYARERRLGDDPARCPLDGNALGGKRNRAREDRGQRVLERQQALHRGS